MNIQDIAALVQIRNYAFSVREDRNVFRGSDYHKVTSQIRRIDSFLSRVIAEEDLVKMVLQPPEKKKSSVKVNKSKSKKHTTMELPASTEVSDSQIPLDFDSKDDIDYKYKEDKEDKEGKELSDDEAEELLAKRIAEEKAKLAGRKTA